jgi:hypothetical protein
MDQIFHQKNKILRGLYKTNDGLSWNETTEMLNDLIKAVISKTVETCAKNAIVYRNEDNNPQLDEESILSVADELIIRLSS